MQLPLWTLRHPVLVAQALSQACSSWLVAAEHALQLPVILC